MPRLRIAVVTETYPPEINGVSLSLAKLVEGLDDRGHSVQLVRPRNGGDSRNARASPTDSASNILCRSLPIPRYPDLRMGLPAGNTLSARWTDWRPDVVHIATEGPLGWSALRAANRLGIPVSSDFRTNFHAYSAHYGIGWLRRPIMSYLRHFHNLAQATFVPTDALRKDLQSWRFNNLRVIARGVDNQRFNPAKRSDELRKQWQADSQTLVVLYVGRLAAEKNMKLLFSAFEAIQARTVNARLVVVGDGPEASALSSRFPTVIFTGMKTGEELAQHYASCDLFLFPSLTETFGNVTVEALASGVPVIAFNYAAAAAHVKPAQSGFLAEFGREDHFLALVSSLAQSPERLAGLRKHARESARALSWDKILNQFELALWNLSTRTDAPGTTFAPVTIEPGGMVRQTSGVEQRRL